MLVQELYFMNFIDGDVARRWEHCRYNGRSERRRTERTMPLGWTARDGRRREGEEEAEMER
jgi:hypothetical protein